MLRMMYPIPNGKETRVKRKMNTTQLSSHGRCLRRLKSCVRWLLANRMKTIPMNVKTRKGPERRPHSKYFCSGVLSSFGEVGVNKTSWGIPRGEVGKISSVRNSCKCMGAKATSSTQPFIIIRSVVWSCSADDRELQLSSSLSEWSDTAKLEELLTGFKWFGSSSNFPLVSNCLEEPEAAKPSPEPSLASMSTLSLGAEVITLTCRASPSHPAKLPGLTLNSLDNEVRY